MLIHRRLKNVALPAVAAMGLGAVLWSNATGTCPSCVIGSMVGSMLGASANAAPTPGPGEVAGGATRPTPKAFSATTIEGKDVSLADYRGKVVLIDFWATWCGPCVREVPHVKEAYQKFHDQGFEVLGISLDDDASQLRAFIKARQMPWPQVLNNAMAQGADPATLYGVTAIPTTILVARDGTVFARNLRGSSLEEAVAKALQEAAPEDAPKQPAAGPGDAGPLSIDIGRSRGPERAGLGVLDAPAPEWNVDTWFNLPDGKASLDVADFKGKVVYLYGFQSWCPGCHSQGFPTLQKLIEKFGKADDVAFVAVQTTFEGFDSNTAAKAKATGERYSLSIPIGHSGSEGKRSALMQAYKTGGTPWTIIIDKDGVVRYNDFHITPAQGEKLINALRERPAASGNPTR